MIAVSTHFFYDGIDSRQLGIGLFRSEKKFTGDIAFSQTIEYEDAGNGSMPFFKNVSRSASSFEFLIAKYNNLTEEILPLTTRDRKNIMEYLIKDHPCEFLDMNDEDIKLYCTFKSASLETNEYLRGYMKVTMELFSPYSYLNAVYTKVLSDNISKTIEIANKSNVSPYTINPIIEYIPQNNSLEYFEVECLNTHTKLKVTGDMNSGKYILYCSNCFIDGSYDDFEGDFISLKKGINNLKLTGNGRFNIKVANPITY